MTITGKVFKSFAEAVINKHGYGSNKMITELENKGEMKLLREIEDAERSGKLTCDEAQKQMWEISDAIRWLRDNGYIRQYNFDTENSWARTYARAYRHHEYYGLTAKGWAVADKYLKAE